MDENTRPRSRRVGTASLCEKYTDRECVRGVFVGLRVNTHAYTGHGVRNCERRVITIPRAEFNCKSGLRESRAKIRRPAFREE